MGCNAMSCTGNSPRGVQAAVVAKIWMDLAWSRTSDEASEKVEKCGVKLLIINVQNEDDLSD